MKIYSEDGRCISDNGSDVEFGWNLEEFIEDEKPAIVLHEPTVPVYEAKSVIEGLVDESTNKTRKIVTEALCRENVADLLCGRSLEAKTLLSVVYPSRIVQEQNDPGNHHQNIDPTCQGSCKNILSLMDELSLAKNNQMKYLVFGQHMQQDSGIDCGDGFLMREDELEDSVKNCDYQTFRLHQEIRDLKEKYKVSNVEN